MSAAAIASAVVAVLFAAIAPALGRRLPPAAATRTLVLGGIAVTASLLFVLAVLAFTWVGQLPDVAALGSWSPITLRRDSPIPDPVAIGSTLLLALAGVTAAMMVIRRCRALLMVQRSCRRLPTDRSLVVVDDERADAFTTPHVKGRIVVTTGLLRALDPAERRVVLAHENSHLRHRHPWWVLAADLTAAANPLLRPTAAAIAHAVERWADEDAVHAVVDRRVAARTLARTALLIQRHRSAAPTPAVGVLGADVPARVEALLAPPPRRRPVVAAALAALTLICVLAAAGVQHTGERLFEHAGASRSQPTLDH